jgi:4-hydroxybenzoate polyprenyltransferase
MNTYPIILKSIRWLSLIAIGAVLAMGFVMPISFTQALVYNPIFLVVLMAIFAYSTDPCNDQAETPAAEIHQLPMNNKSLLPVPNSRAA